MTADAARQRLDDERRRLTGTLEAMEADAQGQKDSLSELSTYDQHPGDIGTETFEREKDDSIIESVRAALDDISHAMTKIDKGTYGQCERCHQPIDEDRLEQVPAARFCIEHQAEVEGAQSA